MLYGGQLINHGPGRHQTSIHNASAKIQLARPILSPSRGMLNGVTNCVDILTNTIYGAATCAEKRPEGGGNDHENDTFM